MPPPISQKQPNQDWGSMATSLIPALMGALADGLRGAYSIYLRYEAEASSWERLYHIAEKNMEKEKTLNLILKEIQQSQKPWESRRTLRGENLLKAIGEVLPQDERQLFDMDPEKFVEQRIEEEKFKGMGEILKQFGIGDGDEMAKVLGPTGVASLIKSAFKTRRSKNRYWFYFDINDILFVGDMQTGKACHGLFVNPETVPEECGQLGTGTTDEDDYDNSPERQALAAFLLGNISHEQHEALYQQFRRVPRGERRGFKWLVCRALQLGWRIAFTISRRPFHKGDRRKWHLGGVYTF